MADQDRSEEMKANLGLPSTYHSGPTGVAPKAAAPAEASDSEGHFSAMTEHLRALLGLKGKEPVPNGGIDAINKGLASMPEHPEE